MQIDIAKKKGATLLRARIWVLRSESEKAKRSFRNYLPITLRSYLVSILSVLFVSVLLIFPISLQINQSFDLCGGPSSISLWLPSGHLFFPSIVFGAFFGKCFLRVCQRRGCLGSCVLTGVSGTNDEEILCFIEFEEYPFLRLIGKVF